MACLTEDVAAHHQVHYHGGGQGGVEDGRTYKIVFRLQLLGGFLQIAGNNRFSDDDLPLGLLPQCAVGQVDLLLEGWQLFLYPEERS